MGNPLPRAKPKRAARTYTVIRDTREHEGEGWTFEESTSCKGTVRRCLKTGDYTLEGYEQVFTIDRKGSANEFVKNIYEKRFEAELERMRAFEYAVILLEFDVEDLVLWHKRHPRVRRTPRHWKIPGAILARFNELKLRHPHVHFEFAGLWGKELASSTFKRVVERYEPRTAG